MARAGRVGLVREALGIAAYHVEKYDEAVRELRTHRRISGSNENIALIADAERGRGKPEKALELLDWAKDADLDNDTRTELVIVAAGAKSDQGDLAAARRLIEAEDFTQRPTGALVRLMAAYADVLRLHGETELADKYEELSRRTAKATGTLFGDEEPDPNFGVEIETIEEIPDEELAEADGDTAADAESETAADAESETGESDIESGESDRSSDSGESATESQETETDESQETETDESQTQSTDAEGTEPTPAAEAAPKSKTHVSEKELKKVKVSDDEIEAELDEILADAEADSADVDADNEAAADAESDSADADSDSADADSESAESVSTGTDSTGTEAADAADESQGSDSANGDR
ncbi:MULTISPECIES: hypothetical protein [unclassified Brevibacterium]|uniref:hypothetical protein n=1 Tax=unclassified Brevibacterium TaxID=2614124 RepID=UPI0010F62575|nr:MULTISPECIES: hypothetical protein [unclassified Brevibacterium]MCM1012751.1 hypothetical protein [Brevibacterium sp. XM4083]